MAVVVVKLERQMGKGRWSMRGSSVMFVVVAVAAAGENG